MAPSRLAIAPEAAPATHRHRQAPTLAAGQANYVWAYDFVFDACAEGQQIKCLTIIDEFTRECLAIDVAGSIRSTRVIEVLARLISVHGAPVFLRSDNGPEFVSHAILKWLATSDIDTALIDPGKPWQNGTNESFNGKLRDECLSWSGSARAPKPGPHRSWRRHYNAVRPHISLDYSTPIEFKQQHHAIANQPSSRNDWLEKAWAGQPEHRFLRASSASLIETSPPEPSMSQLLSSSRQVRPHRDSASLSNLAFKWAEVAALCS